MKTAWTACASRFVWDEPWTALSKPGPSGRPVWFPGGKVDYGKSLFRPGLADREALVVYRGPGERRAYTYASLHDRVRRVAAFLERAGVGEGGRILSFCRSKEHQALLALACFYRGFQLGILFHRFPPDAVRRLIRASRAALVLYDAEPPPCGKALRLDLSKLPAPADRPSRAVPSEFPTSLLFSSGTVGEEPKVFLSNPAGAWVHFQHFFETTLGWVGPRAYFCMLDFGFGAFPMCSGLLGPLLVGGRVVLLDFDCRIREPRVLKLLERERVAALVGSPAFFQGAEGAGALRTLKALSTAGEKLRPPVLRALRALFPNARIVNLVGQQETGVYLVTPPLTRAQTRDPRRANVFRPIAGSEYRLAGGVHLLKDTLPGIALEALTLKAAFRKRWRGRYFSTGDVVRRRRLGLEFIGRKDKLVKRKGRQLDLGYLEESLEGLSGVSRAKCLLEEGRLLAFIQAGRKAGLERALRGLILRRFGSYALPDAVSFVDEFPTSASGKVLEKRLLHAS